MSLKRGKTRLGVLIIPEGYTEQCSTAYRILYETVGCVVDGPLRLQYLAEGSQALCFCASQLCFCLECT